MELKKSLKKEQDIHGSDVFRPVLENERVRVLKIQIKPGEKTPMHSHPGHLICFLSDQKLKVKNDEGEESEFDLNFGQVLYFEPVTHVVENIGNTEAIALVIELKKEILSDEEIDKLQKK